MRHPSLSALGNPRRGNALLLVAALFALGVALGAAFKPSLMPQAGVPIQPALAALPSGEPPPPQTPIAKRLDPNIVYPIDVIRIIDGDTFEARVRVWPGLDVDTSIRLRGIDAAELHARCAAELAQAQSAKAALESILSEGGVSISRVGIDKYGGRVDATVATRSTADVSTAMLSRGFARAYDGGKRGTWCSEVSNH